MRVYFIRHGQSEDSLNNIFQSSASQLTNEGKAQALRLADRLSQIPFQFLISSPFTRSAQTAEILSQKLGLPVHYSDLFRELQRPLEIQGLHKDDPLAVSIKSEIKEHYHNTDWHYSDEENRTDLIIRAQKAVEYLESLEHNYVLVSTHGTIMRAIMASMLLGKKLNTRLEKKIQKLFYMFNTGFTICEYLDGNWYIVSWNDHSHL